MKSVEQPRVQPGRLEPQVPNSLALQLQMLVSQRLEWQQPVQQALALLRLVRQPLGSLELLSVHPRLLVSLTQNR
jgi:hypothetical protein